MAGLAALVNISATSLRSAAAIWSTAWSMARDRSSIACRHGRGGDDAVEVEIGLGGEEGRGGVADGTVARSRLSRYPVPVDCGVEIGEFAGKLTDTGIDQFLGAFSAQPARAPAVPARRPGGDLTDVSGPKREITASRPG